MILGEVAPGLLRGGSEQVNCVLVVDAGDRLTVVDAGFPAHFDQLVQGLIGAVAAKQDGEGLERVP